MHASASKGNFPYDPYESLDTTRLLNVWPTTIRSFEKRSKSSQRDAAGCRASRLPSRPTLPASERRSAARGSVFWLPDQSMLRAFPAPKWASGLMRIVRRSSPVTATGSRRIFTGFP